MREQDSGVDEAPAGGAGAGGVGPESLGFLTEAELTALELLSTFDNLLWYKIIDEAPGGDYQTAQQDYAEAIGHVHALQNMVLAQAAARAYPSKFRVMGSRAE